MKVDYVVEGECWFYINSRGVVVKKFYPVISNVKISRLILGIELRSPDVLACHTCDVISCINPDHLYVGDAKTNVEDMHRRGRDYHPIRKGTPERVDKAKEMYEDGYTYEEIGKALKCDLHGAKYLVQF